MARPMHDDMKDLVGRLVYSPFKATNPGVIISDDDVVGRHRVVSVRFLDNTVRHESLLFRYNDFDALINEQEKTLERHIAAKCKLKADFEASIAAARPT